LLDTDALAIAGLVGSTDATAGKHVAIAKAVTTILNRFTLSPYSEIKVSLLLTVANPSANVALG